MNYVKILLVLLLISYGCKQNNPQDDFIKALIYRHEFRVSAILEEWNENGSIDIKFETERTSSNNNNHWTPLCFASFFGNKKAVDELISLGANVNFKDANEQTPLILASISGQTECVTVLLENGVNINETDINGYSALIHASSQGNLVTVKLLVDNGCDLESLNGGHNALDFAIFHNESQVEKFLRQIGMKPNP